MNASSDVVCCKPTSWFTKITLIQSLIYTRNVLISVVAGTYGSSTKFAKLLYTDLDAQINIHRLEANPLFDPIVLFAELFAEFTQQCEKTVATLAKQAQDNMTHTLLIIDNAHYLPEIFLVEILAVLRQQSDPAYFHVIFISTAAMPVIFSTEVLAIYADMIYTLELTTVNKQLLNPVSNSSNYAKQPYKTGDM